MALAETVVVVVALACGERRRVEDRLVHFTSNSPSLSCRTVGGIATCIKPTLTTTSLEAIISEDLSTIPEVSGVHVHAENSMFFVSIELNVEGYPEKPLRNRIFAKEFGLMDAFPDHRFDFNLI